MVWRVSPVDGFLVRENEGEHEYDSIDQAVRFRTAHLSRETVCFRLTLAVADGEYAKTSIHLQITPDHLDSLCHDICKLKGPGLPSLDSVRARLGRRGGKGDLIHLRFQLRNDTRAQCIVPDDFPDYEALDDSARRIIDIFASVASSPSFSLYFPANQLSRGLLDACVEAVERHSVLTEEELRSYERAVQLQRLYGGKGGKVLAVVDHQSSSRPETDSCATLGFDVVPRHQGSPPQYGECSTDAEKLRTILADANSVVESPVVHCAPPKYGDVEQSPDAPVPSKRTRPCGDEDGLPYSSSKRVLSRGSCAAISAPALATNERRPAKARFELDANSDGNILLLLHELIRRVDGQEQENRQLRDEIKRLEENVKYVERQSTNCEKRQNEVEDAFDGLEHQHELIKDELGNLQVEYGELEGNIGELEKQMPNVLDGWEDFVKATIRDTITEDMVRDSIAALVREHRGELLNEYMDREREGNLAGPVRAFVRENVTEQMATMTAKMRKALGG